MIEVKGYFSDNENILIYNLNNYFAELANPYVDGKVINNGDYVRYELNISEEENDTHLILQFCIRDNEVVEDGCCNFVHISNIVIPHSLKRQGIAKGIITIMSKVSNKVLGLPFYITGIVNDGWKGSLLQHGGEEDESGDVRIDYAIWRKINTKYGIAYLNKKGYGYTETEPYTYDCCCLEELKMVLKTVKNEGYKKLVPFVYSETLDRYTWEYVEQNKIEIKI